MPHAKNFILLTAAAGLLAAGWTSFAQVQEKPESKPAAAKKGTAAAKAKEAPQAKGAGKSADASESLGPDEQAILKSAESFIAAYNAHDAKAVAELFALKAEFTDEEGNLIKGREAIEQDFAEMFEAFPECTIDIEVGAIRLLTPNIALEEGFVHGRPAPDEPASTSSYVAIHVKADGKWQLASVSDVEVPAELTPHDHLQQLAWMVGDWMDESPEAIVKTSCRWDEGGNYLLQEFAVQVAGGRAFSGTMRIGWDPLTKQLKSWTFDASGAYAEGLWTRIGDEWFVKVHGVNADGQAASAVSVFRYIDDDTMTWRSYDRVVGGVPVEDVPENIIKRHPPAPEN